jgi:hypothetical protein
MSYFEVVLTLWPLMDLLVGLQYPVCSGLGSGLGPHCS